jgi:hypothetical protein
MYTGRWPVCSWATLLILQAPSTGMALAFPVLRPNQQLVRYECMGTKHAQERGHIGVSGNPSGIDLLHTLDEVAVEAWVENALSERYQYISVVAEVRVEKTADNVTSISTAYWTLFKREA